MGSIEVFTESSISHKFGNPLVNFYGLIMFSKLMQMQEELGESSKYLEKSTVGSIQIRRY